MEDIVIIILTLAFTILAAVNQNKKKKAATENKAPVPDFWKVLFPGGADDGMPPHSYAVPEEPSGRESEAYREEEPFEEGARASRRITPQPASPVTVTPESRFPSRATTPGSRRGVHTPSYNLEGSGNKITPRGQQLSPPQENDESPSVMDDFSLRKAIIYREILDPKYF
jgi:hypothetical protein